MKHSEEWWQRRIDFAEDYWNTQNNPRRFQMLDVIRRFTFDSLLEVGCCSGPNLALIKKEFPNVRLAGIDINPEAVEFGKKKGLDLKAANADNLPYPDNSFDLVITMAVLIDVENFDKAVSEIKRVAKKGVLLMEWHTSGVAKTEGHHTIYNYRKYFNNCSLIKVVNCEPMSAWSDYGYIIKWQPS